MTAAAIGVDPALVELMDAVFAEYRETRSPAGTLERDADLWRRLDDLGLVRLTGAEHSGGSGAGWYESAELLAAAVRHGVRIPLAEHDLLACWLLDANAMPSDGAARTVEVVGRRQRAHLLGRSHGRQPCRLQPEGPGPGGLCGLAADQ